MKEKLLNLASQLFPEIQDIDGFLSRNVKDISSSLSIGQKQRIGLLRAVLRDPNILILDEFTSALDSKSEQVVVSFIDKNYQDAIIFIIGHRAESMLICNRKLKIENCKFHDMVNGIR